MNLGMWGKVINSAQSKSLFLQPYLSEKFPGHNSGTNRYIERVFRAHLGNFNGVICQFNDLFTHAIDLVPKYETISLIFSDLELMQSLAFGSLFYYENLVMFSLKISGNGKRIFRIFPVN